MAEPTLEARIPESPVGPARDEGERIEQLLAELRGLAGPQAMPRIEELVGRIVGLYGRGLEHLVGHLRQAGVLEKGLLSRLCADELVSSLLVLHGLHPATVTERIERALEEVRPYLGSHAGGVELLGVDPGGTVRIRLVGSCEGCPSSRATVEHTLRQTIEAAAPERTGIEVEGAASPRIRLASAPQAPEPGWTLLGRAYLPRPGARRVIDVRGAQVLLLGVGERHLAYRNRCPGCGARLDAAALAEDVLTCGCGARFDVVRGGRRLSGEGPPLSALPLLPAEDGLRIAAGGV
jgi:Fe-S cluster biogenesis protein NfuA/nitrite reductase/ring-hydroxylating ferredoxin subunit